MTNPKEAASQFVISRQRRRGIQNDSISRNFSGFRVSPNIVGLARNDDFVEL
jgi:hypothetical protein